MATARKKTGGKKAGGKAKPVVKHKAKAKVKAKAKPKSKSKPARGPRLQPKPKPKPKLKAPGAKPKTAVKAVAKPARKAAAAKAVKPASKSMIKAVAKPKPKASAKAVVPKVVVAKPVPRVIGRLVPATKAALEKAALPPEKLTKSGKPAKARLTPRPAPEVRPLGVLPPGSRDKSRHTLAPRPASPVKAVPKPSARSVAAAKAAMVTRKPEERLDAQGLQYFKDRLLKQRDLIMRAMGYLETTVLKVNPTDASSESAGYSFHMADAGTDSMEREISFDLASKEGRVLREIDEALRRIYGGVYGLSEVSGKPIARARLEAMPWARTTVEEQEQLEKEQRAGRLPATEE